jgi:hypothetical protein
MEDIIKQYEIAVGKTLKAKEAEFKIKEKLDEHYKNIELSCFCGECIKVKDVELIHELSGGYLPCGEDNWEYHESYYFICKKCANANRGPKELGKYAKSFKEYVKVEYNWYSERNRNPPGKLGEIIKPYIQKKDEIFERNMRVIKAEESKKLLKYMIDKGEINLEDLKKEIGK